MTLLCPECEGVVLIDVDEAEEGDTMPCDDCGVELEITSLSPLKVEAVDDSGYDDPDEAVYHSGEEDEEE